MQVELTWRKRNGAIGRPRNLALCVSALTRGRRPGARDPRNQGKRRKPRMPTIHGQGRIFPKMAYPKTMMTTGARYGRLTVMGPHVSRSVTLSRGAKVFWWCLCDCGSMKLVHGGRLRSGQTRSCGCLVGNARRANYDPDKRHQ
jgi:hypothetical protein